MQLTYSVLQYLNVDFDRPTILGIALIEVIGGLQIG